MSRWFRVYDDLVDDPKVQRLSPDLFRGLINLWCLASQNSGVLPPHADIAFKLRLTDQKATKLLDDLVTAGLLEHDETGVRPHNWDKRQHKHDISNERVKRFRERQRNADVTVTATSPDTETETEQTSVAKATVEGRRKRRAAETPFPEDFELDETGWNIAREEGLTDDRTRSELAGFRDHALQVDRRLRDWQAGARSWLRKASRGFGRPGAALGSRERLSDGGTLGAYQRAAARIAH